MRWHQAVTARLLQDLASLAPGMFHETCQEHEDKEGEPARVEGWLCACQPAPPQSKLLATEARRRVAGGDVSDDDSVSTVGDVTVSSDLTEFDLELDMWFNTQ